MTKKKSEQAVVMLVTTGFAEDAVIYCLGQLREAGIEVWLVSPKRGLIRSQHGTAILPDKRLAELPTDFCPSLLILPGDARCLSELTTSPAVQDLVHHTATTGGLIVILGTGNEIKLESLLINQIPPSQKIQQGTQEITEFVPQLIEYMLV
jgi:putative intracellular protease/amidase